MNVQFKASSWLQRLYSPLTRGSTSWLHLQPLNQLITIDPAPRLTEELIIQINERLVHNISAPPPSVHSKIQTATADPATRLKFRQESTVRQKFSKSPILIWNFAHQKHQFVYSSSGLILNWNNQKNKNYF